jgi:16S rRNA processing protein RimM
LGKTHGIKGWIRLLSFTEPASNITVYRTFLVDPALGRDELVMDQVREQGNELVAHFEGYDSPEAARELIGAELQVAASELPTLESGEYYWHQLDGLTVVNSKKQVLGRVDRLLATGANDVLVVEATEASIDDHERLIPYLRETVIKKVDLEQKVIEVEWEADYLL